MPNMFGGDQSHPAYMPRKLKENEILIKDVLYTISFDAKKEATVSCEELNGNTWKESEKITPKEVQERIVLLRGKN